MKRSELFIALLLFAAITGISMASNHSVSSNHSVPSNSSQNGCAPELNSCIELVKEHRICSRLNQICTAIANGNASHEINSFETGRCRGGEVFCPLTRSCLPQNSTCNVDTPATHFRRHVSPWGANCSSDREFCSASMFCIPVNSTCSSRALYDWHLAGNTTYGPYGQVCSSGETFCLASMSCIPSVNATCEAPFNSTVLTAFCGNHEKFCGKTGGCIDVNGTCVAFPSVNTTNRSDPGRGWKQLCQVRQSVCTRTLVGLSRCYPKVSHCEGNNQTQQLPRTSPRPPAATSRPPCSNNQTFCEGSGRCMYNNETCCPRDLYHCHTLARCIPFREPCPYQGPSDPCPPSADHCKKLLSSSGFLCNSRFSVCDALVNGNASMFSRAVSDVNQMACHGNGSYCPLSNDCKPFGVPCTLDSIPSMNGSTETPWGEQCPMGKKFCGHTMRCENMCSLRGIYDWITNGNTTYGPKGHACNPGTKFCFESMNCTNANNTCQYMLNTPHGVRSQNVSGNASSHGNQTQMHINDLCNGADHFCLNKFKCLPTGDPCGTFPILNYTGVNDTGTGWRQACHISNPVCERKRYGVDKCFPLHGNCLVRRNVTKYRCFEPRFIYCEERRSCVNASEGCCPPGKIRCPARNSCINASETCCPPGRTFCPARNRGECIPSNETCSQCPSGESFCSRTSRCIRSSDYCLTPGECPPHQTNCPVLGGCINSSIPCVPNVPQSDIIYKTVWYFEQLQTVTPSLFTSGNTIAITSVSNPNGTLVYYNGAEWVSASGISPSTALVLGKTAKISFTPQDSTFHGVILLNYTVIAGTEGQKIDASSSERTPDNVIAIVLLPYTLPPVLTKYNFPCEVKEDSRNNEFALEDKINMTVCNISMKSNIPSEVLPFLRRATVQYYFNALNFEKNTRYAIAAVDLENDPSRGSFRGQSRASRATPVLKMDKSARLNFVPTLNYNGPFSASFAGVTLFKFIEGFPPRALQLSPYVNDIINIVSIEASTQDYGAVFEWETYGAGYGTLLYDKNASSSVVDAYYSVLRDLGSKNSAPSKANVMSSIDSLLASASGDTVAALNTVKSLFTTTFEAAAAETGGVEVPPPRYAPVTVTLTSGKFYVLYSDITVDLKCRVIPVNDAPELTSFITYFPPIPYNLTTIPYNGFQISEITRKIPLPYGKTPPKFSKPKPFIQDVDGDVPGVAIVFVKNSSLGAYYYKTSNSAWQLINLNNTLRNGKLFGRSQVLLLKPSSSLMFRMHDSNILWSNTDGRQQANLLLAAWDQSDNQTDGVHDFYFPTDNNASISRKFASAFTARLGCDNRPGSRGRIDACGRCGGDGRSCLGCDGISFSGAVIDHCGNCTGGTTNKTFNFRKDCGGGCGTSFRDSCGVCQTYGKVRNFTDCAGICLGKARINKCGNCVLGTTGKPAPFGQDLCGICGGDNSTCLDCSGTPRGTKTVDICGSCLELSDSRYNSECMKLGRLDPISGRDNVSTSVTVVGAGLQSYSTASCQFYNATDSIQLATVNIRDKRFVITTVNIAAGKYGLRCTFDSLNTYYSTLNNFTFYDSTAITYSSITPNETEARTGPLNVTIAGSGFPDTGYVRCISNKKFLSPAVYVDGSTVKCLFPNVLKSADLKVSLSFGASDTVVSPSALGFRFYVKSPHPVSISFEQNLQALIVTMNKPAQHAGHSCSGVFSASSVAKFGSRAKCKLRTPLKMYVDLLGTPTIEPSDTVAFLNGSLTAKFEEVTKRGVGMHNLTVQGPPGTTVPEARLSGPSKVGLCAKVRLDASASSGAGGRRLAFNWTVRWAADQDMAVVTSNATADLSAIQTELSGLPSFRPRVVFTHSNLLLGFKYEFGVRVTNFLGEESTNATLVVVRENKQLPVIRAGQAKRTVKASRDITIQAKPKLSPCLDPSSVGSTVLFSWEIDAVGVDLGVTDKPRLKIKKGTLQGGKQYTLTVTASMASDQTLSSTKNIILDVQSGPLVAKIRGGSYRVVGATSTLKLDGSKSTDPDKSPESEWYNWECADANGNPCFVPDPTNPDRPVRLVLPTTSKINIDVGAKLTSNNKYVFTMTYNKGSRKASKTVTIKVQPGSPPDLEIKPQVNTKENPTSIIIIKAIAKSTLPTTNVTLECVEEDGYGFVDLTASGAVLTPLSFTFKKKAGKNRVSENFALVIAANTLSNGVSYKFRATVAHADSSAIGETIITTNAAPSQGILGIHPTNGTAMETLYKLSASEGWSDDPDDLPLKYQFGYFKRGHSGKTILLGMFEETNELEDIKFPPGDDTNSYSLTVFVDCKDALGAVTRQTATVIVMPKVIDAAFLDSAKDDILKFFESGDWNSGLGNMGALLSALPSGSSGGNQTAAVTAMKEAFADSTLGILQNGGVADDPAAKSVMFESMGSITEGGSSMSDSTKKNIKDTIVGIETGLTPRKRRRRDVASSSTVEVYTVSQAETTISLVSNLIDPNLYDSSTMATKVSLLPLVDSSGVKVCAGLALGMSASIVKNNLVVLRAEKNSLATADTAYTEMACNDCPSNLQKSAKIKLGVFLQTAYSSWSCTSEDTCSGVCLISSQQIYDLLSTGANNKTLTNVVDFKLYNPETYAAISISTLDSPVTYHLPVLKNVTLTNETYFQCMRWSSSWTSAGCVTNPTLIEADNGTKYIECSCTEVGYLAAFQVDSLPTTAAPTTVPQTAPPTNQPIQVRKARFALDGDYDTLVGTEAKKAQFKQDVRKTIASVMNVNESRIVNITLTKGSIIVIFTFIPGPSDSDASMDAAVNLLESAVKGGNFSVTLSDGTVLKADPNSFSWTKDTTDPTVQAVPVTASPGSGLTETEIIIISVVCGLVSVIILVVVVVVCHRKKTREFKISPESSRAQLGGNDVEMTDRGKRDGNYNEA